MTPLRGEPRSRSSAVTKLDSHPRVILVPGIGIFTAGRTKQTRRIAAGHREHTLRAKTLANSIGRYTALSDADLFDRSIGAWSKRSSGRQRSRCWQGSVAWSPGLPARKKSGFAVCREARRGGAHVVVTDLEQGRLDAAVAELDPSVAVWPPAS